MNNPQISVIIPVYNVEPYLRECLDSVVNQTFRDLEIICVNDGSTDGSAAILDEYAAKDSRINSKYRQNFFILPPIYPDYTKVYSKIKT